LCISCRGTCTAAQKASPTAENSPTAWTRNSVWMPWRSHWKAVSEVAQFWMSVDRRPQTRDHPLRSELPVHLC
jgi:hypothetical protein